MRAPKEVMARELGSAIPEHIQVQVLEESPTTVYLVLPPPTPGADPELADEELEAVAGGSIEDTSGGVSSTSSVVYSDPADDLVRLFSCEESEEAAGGSTEDCDFGGRPTDGTCWLGLRVCETVNPELCPA